MPQAYSRLTAPTLLISGEYDQIIPVKLGRKAAAYSSEVEHVVIANTGHFPMLEDAATYLQLVQDFLQVENSSSAHSTQN
jgi:proline iminopeptidase